MYGRIGRLKEMEALLQVGKARQCGGSAAQILGFLQDAAWKMKNAPGQAFKCGPFALSSIRKHCGLQPSSTTKITEAVSDQKGFSLAEVQDLARDADMAAQVVELPRGQFNRLPVPSIVHWKLGHYAALVERSPDGAAFRVVDRTFGFDGWVSAQSLEEEASGKFLVFAREPLVGMRKIEEAEASQIYGRGSTNSSNPDNLKDEDKQVPECQSATPMASYSIHAMLVSLHAEDTPIGYNPPAGPAPFVKVYYNERETNYPANPNYTNFGPKWNHTWNSYIEVPYNPAAPTAPPTSAMVLLRGGGVERHSQTGGAWIIHPESGSKLVFTTNSIQRQLNDGRSEYYTRVVTGTNTKRYLLTAVADECDNRVSLYYNDNNRLHYLSDEYAKATYFRYPTASSYKVSSIEDPFGREASFLYNASGELWKITDVIGIVSEFTYDPTTLLKTLTTPYGTTTFERGSIPNSMTRWIEVTNPKNQKERVEFRHDAPGISVAGDPATVPSQPSGFDWVYTFNHLLASRNSFYWNRKKYEAAKNPDGSMDYTKATIYHWLHTGDATVGQPPGITSGLLESIKEPLQYRVWFNYPGQTSGFSHYEGTSGKVRSMARRIAYNGDTECHQFKYNALGHLTEYRDPITRNLMIEYNPNGIDIKAIGWMDANGNNVPSVRDIIWNSSHRPTSMTVPRSVSSGDTTQFTWNSKGQVTKVTDPLANETVFTYNGGGNLTKIAPPLAGTSDDITFAYDSNKRVKTRKQWAYEVTYGYDALDRVTSVTYPDGSFESMAYDRLDPDLYRDRLGRFTNFDFDELRQLKKITDPLSRITQYQWCKCGGLAQLTDAKNQITQWRYDIQGRLEEKEYPDATIWSYDYDPARGLLASMTDARNQTKAYSYALDGRLAGISYANAQIPTPSVGVTWNNRRPYPRFLTDARGSTWYHYYGDDYVGTPPSGFNFTNYYPDRLAFEQTSTLTDAWIKYTYDKIGRVEARNVNGGSNAESWTFDALGRIASTTGQHTLNYLYAAAGNGRLTSIERVFSAGSSVAKLQYAYQDANPARPPQSISYRNGTSSSTTAQQTLEYTSAVNGRIDIITSPVPDPWNRQFGYDAADQLTSRSFFNSPAVPTSANYHYDAAGNMDWTEINEYPNHPFYDHITDNTNFTTEIRKGNSLGTVTPYLSLTKDANGNITGWTDVTTGQSETYAWDAENRLVKVTQSPANKEFLIRYDGLSRAYEIEYKWQGVTQKTTRLIWSGLQIVEERDMSQPSLPLVKYYGQGESQFISGEHMPFMYLRDHLGSVAGTFVFSPSSTRRFEEFGSWTGTAAGTPGASKKTFTGMYQPEGLDIMMAVYRWYSPKLRTWISRDPIGEAGGFGLYTYCYNDPVNLIDPDGRDPMSAWGFPNMGPSAALANHVYQQTGSPAAAQQAVNQMGGHIIEEQGRQMATGYALGVGIPAAAVGGAALVPAAVEAAPVAGAMCELAGYRAANTILANPASSVTALQTALAAAGLSTRNPPTPWNPYPSLGSLFNRIFTQPTINAISNSSTGNQAPAGSQ